MKGHGLTVSAVGLFLLAAAMVLPGSALGVAKTVREPAWGLPHFYGDTDLELAHENGREIAKDRLGQLILLTRAGRGNLYQVFGALDASTLDDDIIARRTAYTSTELNNMYAKLPQSERDFVMEYCRGVNETIEAIYAGDLPEPIEVTVVKTLGFALDLFGNKLNISDQVDPNYAAPGGLYPNAGFQFTPEMVMAIAVLEIRNFGINDFGEASRFAELQKLIATQGATPGAQIWDDLNYLIDPLAGVTVPDPTTPGYGGPLSNTPSPLFLASTAFQYPNYDYVGAAEELEKAAERRADFARRLGAWPALGSYAWTIAGNRSATGNPWLGGFPQTGIQTPSIMHFAENRSSEGSQNRINSRGMEFAGTAAVLIGQTDTVGYTSTTAQLRIIDNVFEKIINEDSDILHYNDMGTPAAVNKRTESWTGISNQARTFWRTHERNGNGGSRPIDDFIGDREGTADSGTSTDLVDAGAFDGSYVGGYVAIVGRIGGTNQAGVGQIRNISAVPDSNTLTVGSPWTVTPDNTFQYVAVKPGNDIIGVAQDNSVWQEESTAAFGFFQMQRAENVLDIRRFSRMIPSTHNFPCTDNQPFNGVGTQNGNGNIAYYSTGFSRKRQGGLDSRLPVDGTASVNPLIIASGTVDSATASSLTASTNAFNSFTFAPLAINYRYDNPTQQGTEYIVVIASGSGARQSRRITANTANSLDIDFDWGVIPANGDTFEVSEIVGMPEAVNPAEGYMANWNNKAATADEGENFGRLFRHIFILERLAADTSWTRDENRQLNKDVAGLESRGDLGRYLIPRLREAVDGVGNGGNTNVDSVLAALEAHQAGPDFGRRFNDPIVDTLFRGEVQFLNNLANDLAQDIFGDEFAGAISVPTGSRALNIVQHAIDSAANDLPGAYAQVYTGDYFNGADWRVVVRDSLSSLATSADPFVDTTRPNNTYNHPLAGVPFHPSFATLSFEPTLTGNRGTYEQIVETGPVVNGEFMFPLGQSGFITGTLFGGVTSIDPNVDSMQPVWRDWRFLPMLHVTETLGTDPDPVMCYKVKKSAQTAKFVNVDGVALDNAFESGTASVKKPKSLCAPADTGDGVLDPVTHLASHIVKPDVAHTPQIGIEVTDQFGTLIVDTVKAQRLMVPTLKGLGSAPVGNPSALSNHYECYKIKLNQASADFTKPQVTAVDQFENRVYDLKKPLRLCIAVDKNGEGVPAPAANLMCYKAKAADGEPDHVQLVNSIHLKNQFVADLRVDTVKEFELCVPAVRTGVTGEDLDGDGVLDGYERWYYGNTSNAGTSDTDGDGLTLLNEYLSGADPTDADTDDDGSNDGADATPQDRLLP